MLRTAGLRHVVAAIAFRFCAWRSDAAGALRERWEKRAERCRRFGDDA